MVYGSSLGASRTNMHLISKLRVARIHSPVVPPQGVARVMMVEVSLDHP